MPLPPGPSAPAAIQFAERLTSPLGYLRKNANRFGDAFTGRFPGAPPWVFLSSPGMIRDLFTGDPDVLLGGKSNAALLPVLGSSSLLLLDGKDHVRQQITLDVILRVVFGVRHGEAARELRAALLELITIGSSYLLLFRRRRSEGALSPFRRVVQKLDRLDRVIVGEIERRRAAADLGVRTDVLSLLLSARDEAGASLTDAELRDELATTLLAGYETTSTMLAWVVFAVLAHPYALASLLSELKAVVGASPFQPAHAARLEFLDATLKEALRIYPPVIAVGRVLQRPANIGGLDLPEGVLALATIWLAHRRRESYPAPDVFHPERFLNGKIDPYAWLPFGGGARRCLGMAFALYEAKIVLAELLHSSRLRLEPGYLPRVTRRGVTLAPRDGVRVVLDRMP
jgi:cytochrome P450